MDMLLLYKFNLVQEGMKEGIGLFNDALNTFYLQLYGIRYMAKNHCMVYSFWLAAMVLLYVPFHRQDSTYYGIC